jgi:hypothetical protein
MAYERYLFVVTGRAVLAGGSRLLCLLMACFAFTFLDRVYDTYIPLLHGSSLTSSCFNPALPDHCNGLSLSIIVGINSDTVG